MTPEDQWVGDLGHLALADSMLGNLLIDVLKVLAHAKYPERPKPVDSDQTTKRAARQLDDRRKLEPELFGDTAEQWLSDVFAVADMRNELLHAVALIRCDSCGAASHFIHPRTGQEVDRSDEAVRDVTARILALEKEGMAVAEQIAERVNARILARARLDADRTGEAQNPPHVYPRRASHTCANCAENGIGSTTVSIGPAVVVLPHEQMRELRERLKG